MHPAPIFLALLGFAPPSPAVVASEFVHPGDPPTPSCHASTLAETPSGLLAAWFGGKEEGSPDVSIYLARRGPEGWSAAERVADGVQADGGRLPCWNPVLFRPEAGPTLLFFKVGPDPAHWWGMLATSIDDGRTWSPPRRLPDGILGPIKNKPIALADGALLCPSSAEDDRLGWRVFIERTADLGRTWEKSVGPLNDGLTIAAIQPSLLRHPGDRLQLLCRTRQGRLGESWSEDHGRHWSPIGLTDLPNPNAGTDALTLADGRHLLVSNPTTKGRTPLVVSTSDDGKAWRQALVLEDGPGEYSYPAAIQGRDGRVHVAYTWKRERIRHVALDPGQIR